MFIEERRREIIRLIQDQGQVSVAGLSSSFAVSPETIRGDLKRLEAEEQLVRTHGGAMAPRGGGQSITFFSRIQSQVAEKQAIARLAARMVRPKDRLFMDASSTSLFLARYLAPLSNLTIITDSVRIVLELASNSGLHVICTGGTLRSSSFSLMGPTALDALAKFNADIFFCSCTGLTPEAGATESDEFEIEVKQAMAARAERRILMLDHTKFGRVGLSSFLGLDRIDQIVTDSWNEELLEKYPQIYVPDEGVWGEAEPF